VSTDVSEEHVASIFREKKSSEQETRVKAGGFLFGEYLSQIELL
jgi:hypothetical protein